MKQYIYCLALLLALPMLAWSQNDLLQKMKAVSPTAPPMDKEQVKGRSPEEVHAYFQKVVDLAEAQANAGSEPMQMLSGVSLDRELTVDMNSQFTEGSFTAPTRKVSAHKVAGTVVTGGMVAKDTGYSGSTYLSTMKLWQDADGKYYMSKVYSLADTVSVNIDAQQGTVEIPAQHFFTHATYGDLWICPVDLDKMTYNPNGSVTGTIDANGVITLSSWIIIIRDENSTYNGRSINVFTGSVWTPTNATITSVDTEGESSTYDALIEQTSDNEIRIYNFVGNNAAVSATITPSKAVKISPQLVLTSAMYGAFYCYPADFAAKKVYMDQPIVGTGTDNTVKFGNWVVCQRNSASGVALKVVSTDITTSFNINYPAALNVQFEGEGTEASPYLISSPTELAMLSQAVGDGETYQNTYFKQTQDISLDALTGSYQPVGDASAKFEGTYDGAGYTIADLKLNSRGFSNTGVFGYVGTNGTVKNLNVKNFKLVSTGSNVGFVAGTNAGTVSNCHVSTSAASCSSDVLGGVVGMNDGTVADCMSEGTFANTGEIGGIVGENFATVRNCCSKATLSVGGYYSSLYHSAGGVVGYQAYKKANTADPLIEDCYFAGQILDTNGYARIGGVVGTAVSCTVQRCFNVGTLYAGSSTDAYSAAGGLFGMASEVTVSNCYNAALLTKVGSTGIAGGLTGYQSLAYTNGKPTHLSTYTNCYNSGMINASFAKGQSALYGTAFEAFGLNPADDMFTNCYSDLQMTGFDSSKVNKPSSFFISGTLPEGFSSDVWVAEEGFYPVLKSLAGTAGSKLSAASIAYVNGETRRKVKTGFALNVPSGSDVLWGLATADGDDYVTSTDGLAISGNTATIKDAYSTETLVAYPADKSMARIYYLSVVPKVFEGDGTETSPYLVSNVSDFEKIYNAVTVHHQPHEGDFFKLTNDIDFKDSGFTGVNGSETYYFGATFDGDNHYIHNFTLNTVVHDEEGKVQQSGSYSYAGLFGVCSPKSTIKNVRMAADNSFTFYAYSAPIVGFTQGNVINCRNYADVVGEHVGVAGIVGVADSVAVVSGCYNAGNIKVASSCAAGIVAYNSNDGLIELCQNDGDIEALYMDVSKTKDGAQSYVGGITAYNYGTVDRCVNNGTVSAYKFVGGLIGNSSSYYGLGNVTNSVNNGIVVAKSDEDTNRGGIIGGVTYKGKTINNYYDASITTYGAARNTSSTGVTGLSTKALISGAALEGLSAEEWNFKEGQYPVLKAFEDEEATIALRKTYVAFGDGEVATNVVKNTALSADSNIKWSLKQNKNFTLAGDSLNVTVPTDMIVSTDTLTATYGTTCHVKTYCLSSVPVIFTGAGSVESPFQITSVDDMNKLAEFVESSGMEYAGYYFKVMNDIDYAGDSLKIIASGNVNFKADFDGNGKTIKDYVFENTVSKTGKNLGMFANVGSNGVIHDLTIDGKFTAHSNVGGLVGKLSGTVRNCVNKSTVTALSGNYAGGLVNIANEGAVIDSCVNEGYVTVKTSYAGGIVARAYEGSAISACTNKGKVITPSSFAGGIVAYSTSVITDCVNEGELGQKSTIGGIVAYSAGADTIVGCHNTADIVTEGSTVGGIVGSAADKGSLYVKDCYNTGNIEGAGTIGGLIASIGSGSVVVNCYNTGELKATTTGSAKTGGITGSLKGDATYPSLLSQCYNIGNITSGGTTYVAGIAGYVYKSGDDRENVTVSDCFNLGDITVNATKDCYAVGGIAGTCNALLENCWNAGSITSNCEGVGGIAGVGTGAATGCANYGSITTASEYGTRYTGGLWGYQYPTLTNCFNMGAITGMARVSGINGMSNSGFTVKNVYNSGLITVQGDDESKCSNFTYYNNATAKNGTSVENAYYDASVNSHVFANDTLAVPLLTQQMFSAELGEGFEYNHGAYPTNPNFKERAVPNFFAANIEYIADGDTATNINDQFYVGALEGVTVTSSDNITIDGNLATPTEQGTAWVKFTTEFLGKTFEKTFDIVIAKVTTGIDSLIDGGKTPVARDYYEINGMRTSMPVAGKFYIVKTQYSDGTVSTKKVFLKK